ncbi:alpha/beta fold hydrolase [Paenibacillus thermotolerans]|uniref:alpha/beta fold hydrolase n=1 Tax=Paenibacillus thermotolerans TaxID=3027807 RepID=UPI0023683D4E|nr:MULTISPECIES: alpha/beta hydrolase [unclassified Paenibacillus]
MTQAQSIPVFKKEAGRKAFMDAYDRLMLEWPIAYETFEIPTDYGDCHVIASGPADGKPIVLFHGMTGNSAMWYPTMEALQTYRTYSVDAPGDFGKSTVSRLMKSPEDAARWIDQLLDALGLETTILLGHSMGGWFSANYALSRPERVERLMLLAPVATFLPPPLSKLMKYIYPALLIPSRKLIKRGWDWFCSAGYTLPQPVMEVVYAGYKHGKLKLGVIPGVIPKERWKSLTAPVLFIVGDEEKIYDAAQVTRVVRESIPQAETHIVERAGHCLTVERKEQVNALVGKFLSS